MACSVHTCITKSEEYTVSALSYTLQKFHENGLFFKFPHSVTREAGNTMFYNEQDTPPHPPTCTAHITIRESVDSLCRNGANTPIVRLHR